ncbi:MAG: hypothetical protein ACLQIB_46775 [Isosphaeraceae bacterium]
MKSKSRESVVVEVGGLKSVRYPVVLLSLLVPVLAQGSGSPLGAFAVQDQASKTRKREPQERKLSHDETLRWVAEQKAWRWARKTKPIWARAVLAEELGKKFQTADHAVQKARAGYWLCAGVAGEPWFQSLEKIEGKYEAAGEEVKTFGFDEKPRTYRIFKPKATTRNWVAQIKGPGIVGFFIRPNYDPARPLYSPAGGYVVRDDVKNPYQAKPDDVWLVQQGLFESTYELIP